MTKLRVKDGVVTTMVCERWCVKDGERWRVTKSCVKNGVDNDGV